MAQSAPSVAMCMGRRVIATARCLRRASCQRGRFDDYVVTSSGNKYRLGQEGAESIPSEEEEEEEEAAPSPELPHRDFDVGMEVRVRSPRRGVA